MFSKHEIPTSRPGNICGNLDASLVNSSLLSACPNQVRRCSRPLDRVLGGMDSSGISSLLHGSEAVRCKQQALRRKLALGAGSKLEVASLAAGRMLFGGAPSPPKSEQIKIGMRWARLLYMHLLMPFVLFVSLCCKEYTQHLRCRGE